LCAYIEYLIEYTWGHHIVKNLMKYTEFIELL